LQSRVSPSAPRRHASASRLAHSRGVRVAYKALKLLLGGSQRG
jgi:hypothetical protein